MSVALSTLAVAGVLALLIRPVAIVAAPPVTEEDLDIAIKNAANYLWSQQEEDGGWDEKPYGTAYPGGVSALVTYALLEAGESPHDPRMIKALKHLEELGDIRTTYARSFRALVWSALDSSKYHQQRNLDAAWLARCQHESGAWGYPGTWGGNTTGGEAAEWTDNSNTQVAMLALWEASDQGSEVSPGVWRRAEKHWVESQNADGGWGYHSPFGRFHDQLFSYGTMTAAGLATLHIIYDRVHVGDEGRYTGKGAPRCGEHIGRGEDTLEAIDGATRWLNDHFTLSTVPNATARFAMQWMGYYYYSIDRAGVASGRKYIGDSEWYPMLVKEVLSRQGGEGDWDDLVNTSFCLLSLLKGRAPIAVNKLRYVGDDWNNDPRDVAKLTRWMSRTFERPFGWQIVEVHKSARDLLDAPIVYFNGHYGPDLTRAEREALIDYVWEGGTIVAVACCSQQRFVEKCLTQFREMFPQLTVAPIPDDHPIYTLQFRPEKHLPIIGLSDGCRTRVFLFQQDVCCAWHQGLWATHREVFEIGANLYLYATAHARQRTRLRPMFARRSVKPAQRWRVGRVRYDGDWWADPRAIPHLSAAMTEAFGVGLSEEVVELADADPRDTPLIWITGHGQIALTDEEGEELKRFIRDGGTVLVDAGCGRREFHESFTKLAAALFGADALQPVPADHPLLTGAWVGPLGADVRVVRYKRGVVDTTPGRQSPALSALSSGRHPGLIYSRYGLACPCDGHPCVNCASYDTSSARAIVANIIIAAYQNAPARAIADKDASQANKVPGGP